MRIPRGADRDAEPERMIFWETQVVCTPFIYEGEATGRSSVPSVCRYHVERGLQLCLEEMFRLWLLCWRGHIDDDTPAISINRQARDSFRAHHRIGDRRGNRRLFKSDT